MNGFYAEVIAVLKSHGFSLIRTGKGSHEIWGKDSTRVTVSKNCKAKPTANSIMKSAGIKHRF